MKRICLFDVNETLLDLRALDPEFKKLFGDTAARKAWFEQLIQSALTTIATNKYQPFGLIGSTAFDMVAQRYGITVSQDDKLTLLGKITQLPPHEEVANNLARLKTNGYTIAALTNSTLEVAQKQLQNANIAHYFDRIFSADTVKRLKPSKEAYEMAAESLGVKTGNICLIAAHAWDIAGAHSAGCSTAFIARPGMVLNPLYEPPEIIGRDLQEIVDMIIDADH